MAWDIAKLEPVTLEDETTRLFLGALHDQGVPFGVDEGYASPCRNLPSTWDEMVAGLSTSFRKRLRYLIRKADRAGIHWALHTTAGPMAQLLDISAETWQHRCGTGLGSTEALRKFYESIASDAARTGSLQLALLYSGERPIAFELNLCEVGKVYNVKIGYRSSDANLSPGHVLRHHVLRHAVESGMSEFDFLGVEERYKLEWADSKRLQGSIFVVRRGLYWRLFHLVRYRFKAVLERYAPWVLRVKRGIQSRRAAAKASTSERSR